MSHNVFRIGLLRDVYASDSHDFGGNTIDLVIEEANLLGAGIELVSRRVERAAGTHHNVEAACRAWEELVHDEQVIAVIGPSTTPVAIALRDRVDAIGVPGIHWAGTERASSRWQFQYQAGYFPDEGPALAYLMSRQGRRRVACFRSEGDYGEAYLNPFVRAATRAGIEIVDTAVIPLDRTDLDREVAAARASGADAVVAMGLFGLGVVLGRTIKRLDWPVHCYGNFGFALYAGRSADAAEALHDWVAVDMLDPFNCVAAALFDRYEQRFGIRPATASACLAHDLATLIVEAVRRAPGPTRDGMRQGLEAIEDIASAAGGAGTRMGFGPQDRLALKGPRIFLFSRVNRGRLEPLPG